MKTILFVEDDPVIIQVYRGPLQNRGFEVTGGGGRIGGYENTRATATRLGVLDVMMPKVDGKYVLKFIHSRPELKATKVIVLSNATHRGCGEWIRWRKIRTRLSSSRNARPPCWWKKSASCWASLCLPHHYRPHRGLAHQEDRLERG